MNLERLVLITRRFWPLVGGAERIMADLAASMTQRGIEVTLLTAQWDRSWPTEMTYRGIRVLRLAQPATRVWGTWQYMRHLSTWLRGHPDRYQLVFVSMLKHDLHAALQAVGPGVPVVARAEGAGSTGDCAWQRNARFGRRIQASCSKASALVAPSREVERELIDAGYASDRIERIPNGVPIPPPISTESRTTARAALAEANAQLAVHAGAPVVLYAGRLHEAKGLGKLLDAWDIIARTHPNARLWLAGDGPYRQTLEEQIAARGLFARVVLAGVFDDTTELVAAADLFVLPSRAEGMSLSLLEAMAAGLPLLASDIPGNRELLDGGRLGRLVGCRDLHAWVDALRQFLDHPDNALQRAAIAREHVIAHYSIERCVDRHLALFKRLSPIV